MRGASPYRIEPGHAERGEVRSLLRLTPEGLSITFRGRYEGGEHVTRIIQTRVRKRTKEHITVYTFENEDHARALYATIRRKSQ